MSNESNEINVNQVELNGVVYVRKRFIRTNNPSSW